MRKKILFLTSLASHILLADELWGMEQEPQALKKMRPIILPPRRLFEEANKEFSPREGSLAPARERKSQRIQNETLK